MAQTRGVNHRFFKAIPYGLIINILQRTEVFLRKKAKVYEIFVILRQQICQRFGRNSMKIVIAFDSFKGSLSAEEVCSIVRETITAIMPEAEIVSLPIADGGEGTTAAICQGIETKAIEVTVHDPLLRKITASYAITSDGKTAIMEMAAAAGLTLLAEGERNVMRTTTVGVGEMMQDAIERGCKKIIIGIGGSATNE